MASLQRLEQFTNKPPAEITASEVRRFLRETDFHPSTKSSSIVAMKAFDRWGVLEGIGNPAPSVAVQGAEAPS